MVNVLEKLEKVATEPVKVGGGGRRVYEVTDETIEAIKKLLKKRGSFAIPKETAIELFKWTGKTTEAPKMCQRLNVTLRKHGINAFSSNKGQEIGFEEYKKVA